MQSPTSNPPTKLKIRTYACRASAARVKAGLEKLVETSLAFNESWLLGEFDEGSRIGGLRQHGDIIIRHTSRRPKSELTIEYRANLRPGKRYTVQVQAANAQGVGAIASYRVTTPRR